MRHAGITPLGLAGRPTHQFNTIVSFGGRDFDNFRERQFGEDRANKTELHGVGSLIEINGTYFTSTSPLRKPRDRGASHASTLACAAGW